jgi:AcrR family transcriptional regulator
MPRTLSEDARAKMVATSQELLAERGVDGFSVDEVARRSGVAKSTIYRHFGSGEDLMLAAVDELVHHVEAPDTGAVGSDLRAVVRAFLEVVDRPELRGLFVSMLARARTDPEFAARLRAIKEQRHSPLRLVLQRGIARGEVDPEIDLEVAMHLVQSPFVALIVEDEELRDRDVDAYLELIGRALAPPG